MTWLNAYMYLGKQQDFLLLAICAEPCVLVCPQNYQSVAQG
jgi:hypothetical protein